jgi:hypothetical protein
MGSECRRASGVELDVWRLSFALSHETQVLALIGGTNSCSATNAESISKGVASRRRTALPTQTGWSRQPLTVFWPRQRV